MKLRSFDASGFCWFVSFCFLRLPVVQAGLELPAVLLPQSPENWDYRCTAPSEFLSGMLCYQAYTSCGKRQPALLLVTT